MNTISILFYVYQNKGRTTGQVTKKKLRYCYKQNRWQTSKGIPDKPEMIFERPIYMRVTINSRFFEMSTQESIRPDKWNDDLKKPIGTGSDARRIQNTLSTWQERVRKLYNEMDAEGKWILIKDFKTRLLNLDKKVKPVLFSEACMAMIQHKTNRGTSTGYIKSLTSRINAFQKWIHKEYGGDVSIDTLNKRDLFIKATDYFIGKYENGTINGIITDVKMVFTHQEKVNPDFKLIALPIEKLKIESSFKYYTEEQQKAIQEYQPPAHRFDLWMMKQITLFQIEVGLAFSDLKNLKQDHIHIKLHEGKKRNYIYIDRKKTGETSVIPLSPIAQRLIEEIQPHVKAILEGATTGIYSSEYKKFVNSIDAGKGMICPVPGIMTCKRLLDEIGQALGFKMTTHMARHTFATNMLNLGIPMESVSRMLGHKTVSTTERVYAKVLDTRVMRDAQQLDWYNDTDVSKNAV